MERLAWATNADSKAGAAAFNNPLTSTVWLTGLNHPQ
jgi:hypothetical protein